MGVPVAAREVRIQGVAPAAVPEISFRAAAGAMVAFVDPAGGARLRVLLALAGRFPVVAGRVRLGRDDVATGARARRAVSSLCELRGVNELDPELRVAEVVTERCLIAGRRMHRQTIRESLARAGCEADPQTRVGRLPVLERHRLGVALGLMSEPEVLIADDVDVGVHASDAKRMWLLLRSIAETGTTVLAGCCAEPGAGISDCTVPLFEGPSDPAVQKPEPGQPGQQETAEIEHRQEAEQDAT